MFFLAPTLRALARRQREQHPTAIPAVIPFITQRVGFLTACHMFCGRTATTMPKFTTFSSPIYCPPCVSPTAVAKLHYMQQAVGAHCTQNSEGVDFTSPGLADTGLRVGQIFARTMVPTAAGCACTGVLAAAMTCKHAVAWPRVRYTAASQWRLQCGGSNGWCRRCMRLQAGL